MMGKRMEVFNIIDHKRNKNHSEVHLRLVIMKKKIITKQMARYSDSCLYS